MSTITSIKLLLLVSVIVLDLLVVVEGVRSNFDS